MYPHHLCLTHVWICLHVSICSLDFWAKTHNDNQYTGMKPKSIATRRNISSVYSFALLCQRADRKQWSHLQDRVRGAWMITLSCRAKRTLQKCGGSWQISPKWSLNSRKSPGLTHVCHSQIIKPWPQSQAVPPPFLHLPLEGAAFPGEA